MPCGGMMRWLQGIHYRIPLFYDLQNRWKLGGDYDLRFRIAAHDVRPGESVLDLCAGFGQLKEYLPTDCAYRCIEASPEFARILHQKKIPVFMHNLHQRPQPDSLKADTAVMVVSLCHFRNTTADEILEMLKTTARKVVIVEDVLTHPRGERSFLQKAMNYLCRTDYYVPVELFTAGEFQALMHRHGYGCRRHDARYLVGRYGIIEQE